MKAGADSATPNPTKETKNRFLGSPHGWIMRNLISRKKNDGEVKGKEKIELVVEEPIFMREMFAPPTPKDVVVQPTSVNGVAVHPLGQNTATEHPPRSQVERKAAVAATNNNHHHEDELFSDRGSTAAASQHASKVTEQILNHEPRHVQYRNSAAASQNAELSFDDRPFTATSATKAQKDTNKILSRESSMHYQYRGSVAAAQRSELLFDDRPSSAKVAPRAKADTQQPTPLTNLIPELQSYAAYRPSINTDKLAGYLNEVATRPRPHKPLSAENEEALFSAQHSARYTMVRNATAGALQEAERESTFVRELVGVPSCLTPGSKKQPQKKPQALKRKNSFDAVTFAEIPIHFDFRRSDEQREKIPTQATATEAAAMPTHIVAAEPARPAIAIPLNPTPRLIKVPTAPSPIPRPPPNRGNSRAAPGWEDFDPHSPLSPAPLRIRRKTSPKQPLNIQVFTKASALKPQKLTRIPSLQRISSLKFDGTLLEGFEGVKPAMPRRQKGDLHGRGRLQVR
jgi:hypothetical protein